MSNTGSDGGGEGSSTILVDEKGSRNKRKHLSDKPLSSFPIDVSSLSLAELSKYEVLLKNFQNALKKHTSKLEKSKDTAKKQETKETHGAGWDEPIVRQLEELLAKNLLEMLSAAVKNISDAGYSMVAAEQAVLQSYVYHGTKDVVSNVVDGALGLLEKDKEGCTHTHPIFSGLKDLVNYTILEMIHVLREIKPTLTIVEAMWRLLLSDLNLINACAMKESISIDGEAEARTPLQSETTSRRYSDTIVTAMDGLKLVGEGHMQATLRRTANDKKLGVTRKVSSSSHSKIDSHGQKSHFELIAKGVIQAKNSPWGKLNLQSGSFESGSSCLTNPLFVPPVMNFKSLPLARNLEPNPRDGEDNEFNPIKDTDDPSLISFHETILKIGSKDDSNNIWKLFHLKHALEKELQDWTEWANNKVMQVARRLGKDKEELKILRREKEEEKQNRDRQVMEENAVKRFCEMENALSNADAQLRVAQSSINGLQEKHSVLKEKLKSTNVQTLKAAINLQEALLKEQVLIKKLQSCDAEKELLLQEMANVRRRRVESGAGMENSKGRHNRFKALWKKEEMEKLELVKCIERIRNDKEEGYARTRAGEENLKKKAERDVRNCKEDIKKLENMISKMRLELDQTKIAALNVGYSNHVASGSSSSIPGAQLPKHGKRLPVVFEGNCGGGRGKTERECVVCMVKEIRVVFLPCAHQVLCIDCNDRLKKQGMNDCPSCRTPILKRIPVTYRC